MPNEFGKRTPVLWLDLDGTVRKGKDELGKFVNEAKDVIVFAGVREMLKRYKRLGWRIVAVSNQGGLALGLLTMDQCVLAIHVTDLAGKLIRTPDWLINYRHPDKAMIESLRRSKPNLSKGA